MNDTLINDTPEQLLVKLLLDRINSRHMNPIVESLGNLPFICKVQKRLGKNGDLKTLYPSDPTGSKDGSHSYFFVATKQSYINLEQRDGPIEPTSNFFNFKIETDISLSTHATQLLEAVLRFDFVNTNNLLNWLNSEFLSVNSTPVANLDVVIAIIADFVDLYNVINMGTYNINSRSINLERTIVEIKTAVDNIFPGCIKWKIEIDKDTETALDSRRLQHLFITFARFLLTAVNANFEMDKAVQILKYVITFDKNDVENELDDYLTIKIIYKKETNDLVSSILNNINYVLSIADDHRHDPISISTKIGLYVACYFLSHYRGGIKILPDGLQIQIPIKTLNSLAFVVIMHNLTKKQQRKIAGATKLFLNSDAYQLLPIVDTSSNTSTIETYYAMNPNNLVVVYNSKAIDINIYRNNFPVAYFVSFNDDDSIQLLFQQLTTMLHR